jgi:hypothetical protein
VRRSIACLFFFGAIPTFHQSYFKEKLKGFSLQLGLDLINQLEV